MEQRSADKQECKNGMITVTDQETGQIVTVNPIDICDIKRVNEGTRFGYLDKNRTMKTIYVKESVSNIAAQYVP